MLCIEKTRLLDAYLVAGSALTHQSWADGPALWRRIWSAKARKKVPHHVSGNLKIDPHGFQTRLFFLVGLFQRSQSAFDAIQKLAEHFYFIFVRAAAWRHER